MNVIDCPGCGSSNVEKNTFSFEYGSSVTWECDDCSWSYTKGSGIGTGTGNSGVHPRNVGSVNQQTLTQVGEYCSNCDTVIAREHACTPSTVLKQSEEETMSQEDVIEELEEWHYSGERELRESVQSGEVLLTPTFYHVTVDEDCSAFREEILSEMEKVIEKQDSEEMDSWSREGRVKFDTLKDRLAIQNKVESSFLRRVLEDMGRDGIVKKSIYGWSLNR